MPADTPELPLGLALAWGVAPEPTRGPKRELSLDRILAQAIAIADQDGLAAVSMGAVAKACGVTTMALYRYVPSKDDLVMLMWDVAIGPPPDLAGLNWRDALIAWAQTQVKVFTARPWALDIPVKGAPNTPGVLAWADAALAALSSTPLTLPEQTSVVLAVDAHARWQSTLTRPWDDGTSALEADPLSQVFHLMSPERLPYFHAAFAYEGWDEDFDDFAFGLDLLLDGVAQLIANREGRD